MPEANNPSGTVSVYGFGCGYVETAEGPIHGLRMWAEGDTYHVRRHHNPDHAGLTGYIRLSWWAFDTLTAARRHFGKEARRIRRGCTTIHTQEGVR